MPTYRSTTRRSVVAAALVTPLAGATRGAFAQEATPSASDIEAIVRSFYEPFNTGDTSVYKTILTKTGLTLRLDQVSSPGAPDSRRSLTSSGASSPIYR